MAVVSATVLMLPNGASGVTVSGYEESYSGEEGKPSFTSDDLLKVLSVNEVEGGENLFVRVSRGDTVIADRLRFTLNPGEDQTDGTLSMQIVEFDPNSTYKIEVFNDFDEKDEAYHGTFSTVYGDLAGKSVIIGYQVVDDSGTPSFVPSHSYVYDGMIYELASDSAVNDSPLTYRYELAAGQGSIDGTITYVDEDGNVVATDTEEFAGLSAENPSKTYEIPSFITGDDGVTTYRTMIYGNGTITASYNGTKDYTITVKKFEREGNEYSATIEFVDGDKTLFTDTIYVSSAYNYTVPYKVYAEEGDATTEYTLSSDGNSGLEKIDDANWCLQLSADDNPDGAESKTYTVNYTRETGKSTWTVTLVKAKTSEDDTEMVLETNSQDVLEGETKYYTAPETYEIDGTTYYCASLGESRELSYTWGEGQSQQQTVYYVPEGYESEDYDITINYVDYATGDVLESHTETIPAPALGTLEDQHFDTAESIVVDGTEYVRMTGQEKGITHGYYTKYREYTVYYRDVNDDTYADVVITTYSVEYVDGGTTFIPGTTTTTTTTTTGGTTTGGTTGATTTAAVPANTQTVTGTDGDGNGGAITNLNGDTVAEERIQDEETALAQGDQTNQGVSSILKNPAAIAGMAAAAAGIIGLILFLLWKRKKDDEDQETQDAQNGGR